MNQSQIKRSVTVVATAAVFLAGIALVSAKPPAPDPPAPTGACCRGPKLGVLYDITQYDCQVLASSYIWIRGNFDPTDDETPCDLLPGGD